MKRRAFIQALGTALVVPLPALAGIPNFKANDYSFTISEVEIKRSELNFDYFVRGLATLDNSPDGKQHNAYFAFEYNPALISLENAIDESKDVIRDLFIRKFREV